MVFGKYLQSTEAEVTADLAKALPRLLDGLLVSRVSREASVGEYRADITAKVEIGSTGKTLLIEVKRIGEPRIARDAIFQLRSMLKFKPEFYPVLAAPYLTESVRKLCKDSGVGYIDLVGNIYLRFDSVLIERTTLEARRQERRAMRSLASPKTSRVVRTLLQDVRQPFRITRLAVASGVSAAEAYKVANLVELKGFAQRDQEKRVVLTKPGELLQAWASALDFSKNKILTAYALERAPEAIMKAIAAASASSQKEYAFTMFAGASLVAPFSRFYDVTCYIQSDLEWWMKKLDLKPVESGSNIQLVIPRDDGVFRNVQKRQGFRVVSNVQLYADLYSNPARGREQAEAIRKKIEF